MAATPRVAVAAFEEVMAQRQATALTQHVHPIERHLLHGAPLESPNNPILKEFGTTLFVGATALYIAATANSPVEDTKLFNRRGDLFVPVLTPALNWFMDRVGETIRPLPGVDAYEHFSEEDKMHRMQVLDSMGKFDRFWQDQHDDTDKLRLMHAITERQILGNYTEALMFPHDNTTLPTNLGGDLLIEEEGYILPSMTYRGNKLLTSRQKYGPHAFHLYVNHFDFDSNFDSVQARATAQYQKDVAPLLSDVREYENLFKSH